jgi:hypothetical protein
VKFIFLFKKIKFYLPRASHRFPTNPLRQVHRNPPTPFGVQLPAFKHGLSVHTSVVRIICPIVDAIVVIVIGGIGNVVTKSSHRTPVKFGKQTHTKPPTDVSEHLPP